MIYFLEGVVYQNGSSGTSVTINADGTTDDASALQTILDWADAAGGGTLIVPSGKELLINSTITVYSNITLTSNGKATLKTSNSSIGSRFITSQITYGPTVYYTIENFTLSNLKIDGAGHPTISLLSLLNNQSAKSESVKILNCEFVSDTTTAHALHTTNVYNLCVEKCSFSECGVGIRLEGRNREIYIADNTFSELSNNPIRVIGSESDSEYTEELFITGNVMNVARIDSYIADNSISRHSDGRVDFSTDPIPDTSQDHRSNLTRISAINIAMSPIGSSLYHQNFTIANNTAIGSDYGFFDGGSADLFSLKDIIRLKCTGNTARNSGDLGFAIERCKFAVVANNTADRNNSCGISIFDSNNVNVTGNVCSNNELSRDGAYGNYPYGGIRVENASVGVLVDGNYCYADAGTQRSFQNVLSTTSGYTYNDPDGSTQRYGIVVKNQGADTPFNVKIGMNHSNGMLYGTVFNNIKSTQLLNTYMRNAIPTTGDYPLASRLRNNLFASSTSTTKEWYVSNRVQLNLNATSSTSSTTLQGVSVDTVDFILTNESVDISNKIYENTDLNSIQSGDIIGVLLDNQSMHWTTVSSVSVTSGVATITINDALPSPATFGASGAETTKTVVCLRWEAL